MHKKCLLFIVFVLFFITPIYATEPMIDSEASSNGYYQIIIEDDADLLSEGDEIELKSVMEPLTEYGNVLFKTNNLPTSSSSESYLRNYYYSILGNKKGVAFYIDMNRRQVCACASGGLEKIITSGKCDSIMDNVYSYATKGDYFQCANQTYLQMYRLLNGGKIAESMKYICNAILAIMISLFTSYLFCIKLTGNKGASDKELIDECGIILEHTPVIVKKIGTSRIFNPPRSSSGGSSGGGGRRRFLWQ